VELGGDERTGFAHRGADAGRQARRVLQTGLEDDALAAECDLVEWLVESRFGIYPQFATTFYG
jgi:hypothetical protein